MSYRLKHYIEFRKDAESFAPKGDYEVFEWISNWKETPPKAVISQDYAWWHLPEVCSHPVVSRISHAYGVRQRLGPWDEQ